MMQKRIIGNATLYLGDCRDILPQITADAVVTDPPYGIGESRKAAVRTKAAKPDDRWRSRVPTDYDGSTWDDTPIDDETMQAVRNTAPVQVIFGGNYYSLPPAKCWLIWDKDNGGSDFADAEMAWTNLNKAVRLLRYLWNGFQKAKPEERFHPTQKPVTVMQWCIVQAGHPETIFDPFMGSGSTGVAAMNLGLKFIGCEREQAHFETACLRIEQAQQQQLLAF